MYTRRQLLTRGTTLLLLVPVVGPILGCSSSSSNSGPDAATCAGVSSTSSVTGQHTHTLCVLTTDLTSPPAAGVNYTTSLESGHTHHVALTAANLTSINSGQTVMVTSTTDSNHSHTFAITKA